MTVIMLTGRYASAARTRAGLVAILLGALELASMTSAGAKALVSETPEKVLPAGGHVYAVSFNPADGRLAVLSNFGDAITVFSPHDWELQHKINRIGGDPANALVFTRDGNIITSTARGDYSHDPHYANAADPRYPRVDMFTLVKYASANGKIMGYFPNPGPLENTMPTGVNTAYTFASSKDGSLLAAVAGPFPVGAHVRVFDEQSGLRIQTIDIPQPASGVKDDPRSVAFSPSGLLGVGTRHGRVHFFDPRSGARQGSIEAYGGDFYSVSALAFSPDGKFVATGKYRNFDDRGVGGDRVVRKHDLVGADIWTVTGAHVAQLIGPPEVAGGDDAPVIRSLSWSPDGSTLAVGDDCGLNIWKINKGKPELILTRPIQGGIHSVAYAGDGTLAAAAIGSVLIFK